MKVNSILRRYAPILPVLTLLGLLSSLLEGVGIGLFVPFLNTMVNSTQPSTGSRYLDYLDALVNTWPVHQRVLVIGACIFATVVLKNICIYCNGRLAGWTTSRMLHYTRTQIHRQITGVALGYLECEEPGKLMNLIGTQAGRATMALVAINGMLLSASYSLVFLVLLCLTWWKLTMLVGGLLFLVSLGMQLLQRQARQLSARMSSTQTNLNGLLHEAIGGAREIRGFGREGYERERFAEASWISARTSFSADALNALVGPLSEVFSTAVLCAILFVAVPLMTANYASDLPKMMAFVLMLYRLLPWFKSFEQSRLSITTYFHSLDEIAAFLDTRDKPYLKDGATPFTDLRSSIRFEHVDFGYRPGDPVLHDVCMQILAGKTTAIVGPSGAGKTTVAALLTRLYDPTGGTILIDDVPLQSMSLETWRGQLGIVSQTMFLFNDTVRNNIAYGNLDASDAEIEEAARLAHAQEFINAMPDGYNTMVGDRGLALSGGQRQRLALARAIVRKPRILILDEATSSLDSLSEHFVQEALNTLAHSHTIIVIAHRLSTVEGADHMIVLDRGRVVEQGKPSVLLDSSGLYARLHGVQIEPATSLVAE